MHAFLYFLHDLFIQGLYLMVLKVHIFFIISKIIVKQDKNAEKKQKKAKRKIVRISTHEVSMERVKFMRICHHKIYVRWNITFYHYNSWCLYSTFQASGLFITLKNIFSVILNFFTVNLNARSVSFNIEETSRDIIFKFLFNFRLWIHRRNRWPETLSPFPVFSIFLTD